MSVSKSVSQYVLYTVYLHRKTKIKFLFKKLTKTNKQTKNGSISCEFQETDLQVFMPALLYGAGSEHALASFRQRIKARRTCYSAQERQDFPPCSGEHKSAAHHHECDLLTEQKVTQLQGSVLIISYYRLSCVCLQHKLLFLQ